MDFLDEIAALTRLPAGGAAAAYTANLGIALVYKVLVLEMNRKELDPSPQATLRVAHKELERLYLDLKKMVKEDPQRYVKFSAASRSDDQAAGKAAFLDILTCSMQVMEKAHDGMEWFRRLSKISSVKLAPNLRVAVELLAAGMAGTAHIVRENLKPINSPEKQQRYLERLESLNEQGMAKKKEVLESC